MTLKHVVFPAPFGPISPRISPSLMSKSTWSSAVTPPNLMVTLSTSRRALRPAVSRIDGLALQCLDLGLGLQRPARAPRREDALRPEGHDQHQGEAEDQQPPVGEPPE